MLENRQRNVVHRAAEKERTVKLGDVLKKEREKKGASIEDVAGAISISSQEYQRWEAGESEIEQWGPALAQIAINLETPTARLLAESGQSADAKQGQAGQLIRGHRERRGKTPEAMVEVLVDYGVDADGYRAIEEGKSPLESVGPRLLAFAELIEQPVFNLFYPCGLPFQELDDYP